MKSNNDDAHTTYDMVQYFYAPLPTNFLLPPTAPPRQTYVIHELTNNSIQCTSYSLTSLQQEGMTMIDSGGGVEQEQYEYERMKRRACSV